jgi:transposase-like protein
MDNCSPFKWRHFQTERILLCVGWYLRYPLSYRDLEEMMLERGLHVDHTTIYRWVCSVPASRKLSEGTRGSRSRLTGTHTRV